MATFLGPIFYKSLRIIDGKNYKISFQLRVETLKEISPKNIKKQYNTSRMSKTSQFLFVNRGCGPKRGFQVSINSVHSELSGKVAWIATIRLWFFYLSWLLRNKSRPKKVSNTLESYSPSLFLFLTSLIFFLLLLPSAVIRKRRKVIGSLVLGSEVLRACGLPKWSWW